MCVHFVLLASGTASDKGVDKGSKAWPPKLSGNQLTCFEKAQMSHGCMIVTAVENITAQIISRWDVNSALKSKDTINVLPVGQLGAECRRDGTIYRLQGLEDKGIGRGGGADTRG